MLRMDAGSSSNPQQPTGHEEFLVINGELVDCNGQLFRSGDYVCFQPGSRQSSTTPDGCTLLVIMRGKYRELEPDDLEG